MKILRLLLTLGFFIALLSTPLKTYADDGEPEKVLLEEDDTDLSKHPKAPAYSPVYCIVGAGTVTVYCEYDAMGSVTVTDADSGALTASASGMLGEGIMIMLPADRGAVRIEVEMNGTIYYAVI